ncbi:MAG: hypothetical protein IJP37_06580 [Clostridia bacterium]|nr:hypothetical protein [Clostridia bacterium]
MANENHELMDQLLRSIGEEANADVPFDRLHDGILLAKKRAEKKRRTLIRTLSAAASFVVLLGVGALFMGHMGFGAEAACDAAAPEAPMAAYDTTAVLLEDIPAETAVESEVYQYSDSYGRNTTGGSAVSEEAPAVPAEPAAPAPETPAEEVSEAVSVAEFGEIHLCEAIRMDGDTCTFKVMESYLGEYEGEFSFSVPKGYFEEGNTYLLFFMNGHGVRHILLSDHFYLVEGDTAFRNGDKNEPVPFEDVLTELGLQ